MASRPKIVAAALGFLLCSAAFGSVALAQDAAPKPDAMSSDHMSSDHMSGMTKDSTGMMHKAKKHMKEGTMSSEHMAPDASKQ